MAPRSKKIDKPKEKYSPPSGSRSKVTFASPPAVTKKRGKPSAVKKLHETVTKLSWRHKRGAGILLTFGQGDAGQLGLGEDVMEAKRPRVSDLNDEMMDIAAGGMHTVVLTAKGEVYTFGCNDEGALGREANSAEEEAKPGKVEGLDKVIQVTAGDSHSAVLMEDGRVFAWGNFRDSNGQIGFLVKNKKEPRPIQILNSVKITKICSGNDHIAALTDTGDLYTFGNGENGQLGRIPEYFSNRGGRRGLQLFLKPDLVRVKQRGKGQAVFEDCWISAYGTWAKVKDTDDVFAFGLNNYCQLGIEREGEGDEDLVVTMPKRVEALGGKKWQSLQAGPFHTLALDQSGKVYSMGRNDSSQCGLGNTSDHEPLQIIPGISKEKCLEVSSGGNVSYALDSKGKVWTWGQCGTLQLGLIEDDEDAQTPIILKGKNVDNKEVLTVSGGGQHTVLIVKRTS